MIKYFFLNLFILSLLSSCADESSGSSSQNRKSNPHKLNQEGTNRNYARIFLKGSKIQGDTDECDCVLKSDTVFMRTGAMLLGGTDYKIKITKDTFIAQTFVFVDSDLQLYKLNEQDTQYTNGVTVPSMLQQLSFDSRPKFHSNEIISGRLHIMSKPYYHLIPKEIHTDSITSWSFAKGDCNVAKSYDDVKIIFKCQLKKGEVEW